MVVDHVIPRVAIRVLSGGWGAVSGAFHATITSCVIPRVLGWECLAGCVIHAVLGIKAHLIDCCGTQFQGGTARIMAERGAEDAGHLVSGPGCLRTTM